MDGHFPGRVVRPIAGGEAIADLILPEMGVHHFTLYLVPPGSRPVRDSDGRYHSSFLHGFGLSAGILGRLRSLLPKPNHWGPVEEFCSSAEWGSDLRIWHEDDGEIGDIVFRFAPVGDPVQLLDAFITIAREAGCHLLVQTSFEVVPPDFERVFHALKSLRAFRVLSDPESVIQEAARETSEN